MPCCWCVTWCETRTAFFVFFVLTWKILWRNPLPWASADILPGGGNIDILLFLSRLLTMRCKWTFTKRFTLSTPFSLCWLNLNSQSFVWNVFYTSAIRNAVLKLPNLHFFEHFLQISHNVRIINSQNNMSGEKTKVRHSQNCFKQWEVELYVDKIIGQLTQVRTPCRF